MKQNYYARKVRQLKGLSKKLQRLQQPVFGVSPELPQKLILKINKLVRELQFIFSGVFLRRILGSAVVLIGLSIANPVSAQSFAKPVANPFGIQAADTIGLPAFADLDGDGDMDLLVAETDGHFKYFQNTGTATKPHFAAPLENPFGLDTLLRDTTSYVLFPAFADLDGDGDMDLLVGESDGSFEYFQNTGTPTKPHFAAPVKNPFGLHSIKGIAAPALVDLDGDGDMDLLVGEYDGVMEYFQNTGTPTNPHFAAPVKNPFNLKSVYYYAFPAFADLDGDGDMDLLVGEYYGSMEYFQNTGTKTQPKFAAMVKNPFGLESTHSYFAFPAFADLDGDGDMDLLVGQSGSDSTNYLADLMYYKNTSTPTGIKPFFNDAGLKLFPNPVIDLLNIKSKEKVEVFDMLGKNLGTFRDKTDKISLSGLKTGIYMVKITFEKGDFAVRKIQKQ